MSHVFKPLVISVVCSLLPSGSLHGWWDSGHMAIALIAKDQFLPLTAAQVAELLAVPMALEEGGDPLMLASVWPDLLKDRGLRAFDSWHYTGIPCGPKRVLSRQARARLPGDEEGQLVATLGQCLATLRNPQSGPWEKAFMLRWLIHLVGDLHQPLHCANWYDPSFPKGDQGGISYPIAYGKITNLHGLWDSALGLVPDARYAEFFMSSDSAPWATLQAYAQRAQLAFPREKLPQLGQASPKAWAHESNHLARAFAYQGIKPGQTPSAAYLAKNRRIVAQQLVLAGYRLADLLNEIFAKRLPALPPKPGAHV
jgi:hypothetical protein